MARNAPKIFHTIIQNRFLMKTNIIFFVVISLITSLISCEPDMPDVRKYDKSTGVFILNEGNFTFGNASLSFLDLTTGQLDNQVFYQANGFPLGDVAYSMAIHDSTAFISINNSGKIFVINTNTFKHLGTISGLSSPRYIQIINEHKAYISDLYSSAIRIFDPAGYTLTGSIETSHSTEQMALWNDYVFVSCWSFDNTILKIDTQSDIVVDSLQVTNQPNSMVIDKNNQLWVLSDGGFEGSPMDEDYPALTQIDPETMKVLKVLRFPSKSGSPNNLVINGNRDSLFFLHGSWTGQSGFSSGVYAMSVIQNTLPDGPLVPEAHHLFYRLGIDPLQSVIYVSDALDYMQQGFVFRFTSKGSIIDSLKADRIPGYFAFLKE